MITAFDSIANNYDETFSNSRIGKAQREIVHKYLNENLPAGKQLKILELNCGTGEDAIYFAKKGHSVLATDLSDKMIFQVKRKAEKENLGDKIKVQQLDIMNLDREQFEDKFDLIFSDFGGLNCINKSGLEKLSEVIQKHLNTSGRLIFVIMSDNCLWEKFYFLLKLKIKDSKRREIKSGVMANLDGNSVRTFYYSPNEVENIFSQGFKLVSKKPVGFAVPPSYLEKFFKEKIKTFSILNRIEKLVYKFSFLSNYSDHFLIDFILK